MDARAQWYGLHAIPDVYIDGHDHLVGSTGCDSSYQAYRALFLNRLAGTGAMSPVRIDGELATGGDSVALAVTFELVDPVDLGAVQASLFVLESGIAFEGVTYDHVTRGIETRPVTGLLAPGDTCTLRCAFPVHWLWDRSRLEAVACLQESGGDRFVIQSAWLPRRPSYALAFDSRTASVPEGGGIALLSGTLENQADTEELLTLVAESSGPWITEFQIDGAWSTERTVPLDPHAALPIVVRVLTDDERRIGTVRLRAHSEITGREETHSFEIFNGSPSILLVDDDLGRPDEEDLASTLDTAQFLYRAWDIENEYQGCWPPPLAYLREHDLVIWQTGFYSRPIFQAEEVASITAYVTGGGHLYMSSADLLDNAPDSAFVTDVLGVAAWVADTKAATALGVPGDPITSGMIFPLEFPDPRTNRVDTMIPAAGAHVILTSETGNPAAVRVAHPASGTVVFSSIPHNVLSDSDPDPNNSAFLLRETVDWLLHAELTAVPPSEFLGRGAIASAPNPSCGITELTVRLPAGGRTRLDLLDPSGRVVRALLDRVMPAGVHRIPWDGRDRFGRPVPAGVYLARLRGDPGAGEAPWVGKIIRSR